MRRVTDPIGDSALHVFLEGVFNLDRERGSPPSTGFTGSPPIAEPVWIAATPTAVRERPATWPSGFRRGLLDVVHPDVLSTCSARCQLLQVAATASGAGA